MPDTMSVIYHELFHSLDKHHLRDAVRQKIDNPLIRNDSQYPTEYYNSLVERRARAFPYYASMRDEMYGIAGYTPTGNQVPAPEEDRKSTRLNSSHSCASRIPAPA